MGRPPIHRTGDAPPTTLRTLPPRANCPPPSPTKQAPRTARPMRRRPRPKRLRPHSLMRHSGRFCHTEHRPQLSPGPPPRMRPRPRLRRTPRLHLLASSLRSTLQRPSSKTCRRPGLEQQTFTDRPRSAPLRPTALRPNGPSRPSTRRGRQQRSERSRTTSPMRPTLPLLRHLSTRTPPTPVAPRHSTPTRRRPTAT